MVFQTEQYLALFSDALVGEIKAEMGRQSIRSSRELGRMINKPSSYMSDRLDGGSPKTGRRVVLTVKDLAAMSFALHVNPADMLKRAQRQANLAWAQAEAGAAGTAPTQDPLVASGEVVDFLQARGKYAVPVEEAAREERGKPRMGDE